MVFHYLGTGKTYLALGFAERNPSRKIILFVPRFLKGHWLKNMKSYGVKNPKRYQIFTHREGAQLAKEDLKNAVVIIDESHRIIKKLESADPKVADVYSKVYLKIQNSHRILSLSGTPIFGDITDVAYQINLVSGKELLPFNKEDFKVNFMNINQHRSAAIGYYAQSTITPVIGSVTGITTASTFAINAGSIIAIPIAGVVGGFLPFLVRWAFPVKTNPLRTFNVEKLDKICTTYVTYYDFDNSNKEFYPSKEIHYQDVSYNNYQIDFLIRYADNQLTTKEVIQLQKDEEITYGNDYVSLNSTKIQQTMKKRPGSGLEIGNLLHRDPYNRRKIVFPYKFKEALELMLETNGPVVLYSHFYHNGILLFKRFLDENGQKGKYAILHPEYPISKYEGIVNKYNQGEIKFLLIHPEITEGISLVGTRQLHILETPYNKSFQEQIIGRAVRYRSHMHLPKKERHVDVYIWKPTFSRFDLPHALALRKNWVRNFSELNYYGDRGLIDSNNEIKSVSPDDISLKNMSVLDKNLEALQALLKRHSIEKVAK
ncbi:MAG: hypothetical protein HRT87_09040 [Legionellales bacterium]|nr:hypothetical protein [Legionellales bacterium]